MTTAKKKAELALWRRRERYRKGRHDHWQRIVNHDRKGDKHPRRSDINERDRWSVLLKHAREEIASLERDLAISGEAKGIDLSNNNGAVDFKKVRAAGYRFVWLKASEGTTFTDGYFAGNVKAAKKAKLKVGAYHFLSAADVNVQAKHFAAIVKKAKLGKGDMLPVIDAEKAGVTAAHVGAFVAAVERQLGFKPIIYTFPAFAHWPSTYGCGLWIAHPGVSHPTIPAPWTGYVAWQHTWTASVPGVNGGCDANITHRIEELIA